MSLAPVEQQQRCEDEDEEEVGGATTIKYIIYQQFSCQVQGVC